MQTMYRDLRHELRDVSIDTLELVDDDTIMRQIEVERRVLRLRDADQQSLGRLNLMIAQLHDDHQVRERENPFRPYLMARALHDVLCDMTSSADVCTMLFDHMSAALAAQLPEYFTAIRAVFESNGVQVRLLARPSALSRSHRDMLSAAEVNPIRVPEHGHAGSGIARAGSHLVASAAENIRHNTACRNEQSGTCIADGKPDPLQDFVWKIFNQSAVARVPAPPRHGESAANRATDNVRSSLVDQLHSCSRTQPARKLLVTKRSICRTCWRRKSLPNWIA
jgi:hypothetical protein